MKVGLVCPYTWDVPGGVQEHIRGLAEALIDLGHQVSVISPADDDAPLPGYVVAAGRDHVTRQRCVVVAGEMTETW